MITLTKQVKLLAIRQAHYTMYVFQDLDNNEYIMCTRLPNWQSPEMEIGSTGFLQYNMVQAGDKYYHPETDQTVKYKYTNSYFVNFVHKSDKLNNDSIII